MATTAAIPMRREPARATGLRPLGWAGLLLSVPAACRLSRIDGSYRRGAIRLIDDDGLRFEIAWATVTRRRFDAAAFVRRKLAVGGKPSEAPEPQAVGAAGFSPLLRVTDGEAGVDRCVGFSPATSRVLECVYHHAGTRQDREFRRAVLPTLVDQPCEAPQRWAFFDASFVAPAGFRYVEATLNLGDMSVRLARRDGELYGPALTVRQVYPAGLALARQPLEAWLRAWAGQIGNHCAWRREGGAWPLRWRREPAVTPAETSRGGGLAISGRLRWPLRPFYWRAPREVRAWMIHDAVADRLLAVAVADRPDAIGARLDEALRGLHWAASTPAPA